MNRPKVLLDISLMGYINDHHTGARGVQRVCRHLFDGLMESGACDLRFVSTMHLAGAYDILTTLGIPPEQFLKFRPGALRSIRSARRVQRWMHSTIKDRRLHMRLGRNLISHYLSFATRGVEKIIPDFLDGADIYHSPLEAIPRAVFAQPKLRHFLTVYDLFSFLYTEGIPKKGIALFKKKILALGRESFAFCISESVKADLLSCNKHMLPEHVFVTPLAAAPDVFHPVLDQAVVAETRKKYGIPDGPYFLALSSFDPRKNFQQVIRCFGELVRSRELNDCNLVIVGSNPERTTFVQDAIARNADTKERIITPGFIPDCDLAAVYSGACAFLFPSLAEGFGLPLVEAMQCGIPVISSNTSAMPEVVGDAGILLGPKENEAWLQAMINIYRDTALREDLRAKGLRRASTYTWKRFIDATLEGYRYALEGNINP